MQAARSPAARPRRDVREKIESGIFSLEEEESLLNSFGSNEQVRLYCHPPIDSSLRLFALAMQLMNDLAFWCSCTLRSWA